METNLQQVSLENKLNGLLVKYPFLLQFMKFVAIGSLGAALDFLVLNYLSKTFNVSVGLSLGKINIPGVLLAIVQNYIWNRYWTFGNIEQGVSFLKHFYKPVLAGGLGVGTLILVILGANYEMSGNYYLILLLLFLVFQALLWHYFNLSSPQSNNQSIPVQFFTFVIVSLIGLVINITIISFASSYSIVASSVDLNKNLAKVAANAISLFWNFIGYKLIVFKK